MAQIHITNLTFAYDGSYDNIFEDVSLALDTSWRLGLVGRNGRGKTTLLRLLQGQLEHCGAIFVPVGLVYFPLPVPDRSMNTEELLAQISPQAQSWELLRELSLLQVDEAVLSRPFETLSNGEQTKVILAALFTQENKFLLMDEPTNHLDGEARQLVGQYLRKKSGFILVSHDRAFLDSCVDHVLSINKTGLAVQRGTFSSWWENRQRQEAFELSQNEKLKQDMKRLDAAAKRTANWSDNAEKGKKNQKSGDGPGRVDKGYVGHKAAKVMKRAKSIENRKMAAVEEKAALLQDAETVYDLKLSSLPYHTKRLVAAEKLSIAYDGRPVCENVTFTIQQGDCVALQGKNGSGKSSLLKLICGQDIPYSGFLQRGSGLIVSYVPQDTSFLTGDLSAFARSNQLDETLFKAILRKLDFSRSQFDKDMQSFSEGQKKKVLLARSLSQKAHLYVWDEPLNFIDVFSRMQIEELLRKENLTLLFVEHDRLFTEKIASQQVIL